MTQSRSVLAACFLLLLAIGRPASACTCIQSGPACQAFWKADAVFDATVEGIEAAPFEPPAAGEFRVREKLVKMRVAQAWKGVQNGQLDVLTASEESACGFDFRPGQRYLVFARKRPSDGQWEASRCSATQPFDGAGPSRAFLDSLTAPARGGRVFGVLRTSTVPFEPDESPREGRVDARLRLTGGGTERTVVTTSGRFEFAGLDPAHYRLELDIPRGYSTYAPGRDIEIPDERACVEAEYHLSASGRITGQVLTHEGRPAAGIEIEVATPAALTHDMYGRTTVSARSTNDGGFEIAGLPAGDYIVGVNLEDLPSRFNPFARTVYPSIGDQADIVTVGVDAFDLGAWRLPAPLAVVKVSGTAVWEDGTPAAGTHVGAWDVTRSTRDPARGAGMVQAQPDGTFVLELREGRTYTFVARDRSSAWLDVTSAGARPSPRLTLGTRSPDPIQLILHRRPGFHKALSTQHKALALSTKHSARSTQH